MRFLRSHLAHILAPLALASLVLPLPRAGDGGHHKHHRHHRHHKHHHATATPTPTSVAPTTVPATGTATVSPTALPTPSAGGSAAPALHVQGNHLVNAAGQSVLLHGVNRAGAEYACIQGWGIFDGPVDAASIAAIKSWHANAVRVPMNSDCWLDINGVPAAYSGATYRQAIVSFVHALEAAGLTPVADLHWSAPGTQRATGQQAMPDRDHAPAFWTSMANTFKGDNAVLFDLYNEPFPDSNQDTTAAWTCWRDGGSCPGVSFQAAGMQELVNAVRATGATNVILAGGVRYANALSQWLTYRPVDPLHNLAASWHSYNFTPCSNIDCWTRTVAPVAAQVPVVAGEIGESDCKHVFIDTLMDWADQHNNIGYLGWAWDAWPGGCGKGPTLITDYNGTPTNYGIGLRDHLRRINP